MHHTLRKTQSRDGGRTVKFYRWEVERRPNPEDVRRREEVVVEALRDAGIRFETRGS